MYSEWPPFVKEQLPWLTTCSLSCMFVCGFSFPFWFRGHNFGSGFVSLVHCLLFIFDYLFNFKHDNV